MCTVTIVPLGPRPGFRLACNRDESRLRPAAGAPRRIAGGERAALAPRDPQGGGTWIAVNDAGVAMALLNRNHARSPGRAGASASVASAGRVATPGRSSRGGVIPAILRSATAVDAVRRARRLDLSPYAPFRLVLADGRAVADLTWDSPGLKVRRRSWRRRPLLFTSSGLGDARVGPPRRALFRRLLTGSNDLPGRQDRFHRHAWPDRPHLSVCMRRPDARTVSHSVIEVGPARARFLYYPDAPDSGVRPSTRRLGLRRRRGAA